MSHNTDWDYPLEDLDYTPKNPPVDGLIPDVIVKWGPASQLRWFQRFGDALRPQKASVWNRYYCATIHHQGGCCESCAQDGEVFDDSCCCRGLQLAPPPPSS